ncbi:MAG: hypothetical protein ACYC2X_10890 [Coriobacteriia bacterium]
MTFVFALAAVLAIIFVVPFVVYGAASSLAGVQLPAESSPRRFLLGVLITKLGTAAAFVLILQLTGELWIGRLGLYALVWFGMFAASEIGDAVSGRSTWREAWLGVLSEAIYAPAAAYAAFRILGIS